MNHPPPAHDAPTRRAPIAKREAPRWTITALRILALAVLLLGLHAGSYAPYFSDDALISLRYARRLLDGHGLTWSDGPRVAGYSNLLWVLACAALGRLGVPLVSAARALGVLATVATVAGVIYTQRRRLAADALPALAGALALVLAAPTAVWSIAGLESPLVAALLTWVVVLADEVDAHAWLISALLGLLCLTRPDGPLWTAALGGALLWQRGLNTAMLRLGLRLTLVPVALVLALTAFYQLYYGDYVPNTARVKVAFTGDRVGTGLRYLLSAGWAHLPLLAGALVAVAWRLRRGDAGLGLRVALSALVLWCGYLLIIGGDIFPAYRLLVPAVALLALLLAEGLAARPPARPAVAYALLGVASVAFFLMQQHDPQSRRARSEDLAVHGEITGRLLARAFAAQQPLLAVDAAGAAPYYSGLPALDMLGLNDAHIARAPSAGRGHGLIGHELGDGAYVLGREPDLVLFCGGSGALEPCFSGGRQMVADARFAANYQLLALQGTEPARRLALVFARHTSPRIGVQRAAGQVIIPGYWLATGTMNAAQIDGSGQLAALALANRPARLPRLALPAGTWRIVARSQGDPLLIVVRDAQTHAELARGASGLSFALPPATAAVEILVLPSGRSARISQLALTSGGAPG